MNKVKFKVTGNGLAGTFFQVDEILGAIKVKANLSADSQASYSVCLFSVFNIFCYQFIFKCKNVISIHSAINVFLEVLFPR